MTWLNGIATYRAKQVGAEVRSRKSERANVDLEAFQHAKVSEKLLARHGANLHPALDDMNAIAQTSATFEPYRATQFGHALDRFYNAVGRQLQKIDSSERSSTAKIEVSTMRSFIAEVGAVPELMPAMATLSSMLEPRGVLDVPPAEHAARAKAAMLELLRAIDGKDGATSMIHAHRHALEMLERAHPNLEASDRPLVWRKATDLILEALPRSGADFAKTAHLTALLFDAIRKHPRDPEAAIAATKRAVFGEQAASRKAARQQIEGMPEIVAPIATALSHILDSNPAGPPELAAAVEELARRTTEYSPRINDPQPFANMAEVLELVAQTPAIRAILDHLMFNYPTLLESEGGKQAIERAAKGRDPDAVPYALVRAHAAQHGGDAEALEEAITGWRKMPPGVALRSSLALISHLNQGQVAPALAKELQHAAPAVLRMDDLTRFAQKFAAIYPTFSNQLPPEDAGRVAAALAKRGGDVDQTLAYRTAQNCRSVAAILKDVPLERTFESLLKISDAKQFGHDPVPMANDLLSLVAMPEMDVGERTANARAAIRTASELGKLDRNPRQTDFPRIQVDWRNALMEPERMTWAPGAQKATALRAKKSVAAFLEAHPKLPPEVAITAAMNLSAEQLGWLVEQIGSTRSQKDVRVLRDVVFAAVALSRVDLIDAIRTSKSDHKATLAAATLIAEHHRLNKAGELPLDRIIEGLSKGEDPASAIVKERAAGALAALDLGDLGKPTDAEGAKILASVQKEITDLLAFFPVGGNVHGVDTVVFRDPLLVAIQSTATGEWPKAKFQGEIADRQLADLSPAARAIWEGESISSLAGGDGDGPELVEAMYYVRGLKEALPPEWDRAMLDRLNAERKEKIEALHRAKRGSTEHRLISAELGPSTRMVAMIELKLAIDHQIARGADAVTTLLDLKPYVTAAIGPARKVAGPGIAEALQRIADASLPIRKPGREGVFAADESRLDAFLTSFGGSCIHPSTGFNRASLAELIMGPQYKMGRIMDGDKPIGRTIFRLLKVKLPNGYEGYALRMDKPVLPTSWTQSPPDDQMRLIYRHGLSKAMAMGVPFMIDQPQFVAEHARGLGCDVQEAVKVQLWIDKGHTGMHHNQGMQTSDYFIAWPGLTLSQTVIRPKDPEDLTVERNYSMTVICPP